MGRHRTTRTLAAVGVVAVIVAACGSDGGTAESSAPPSAVLATSAAASTTEPPPSTTAARASEEDPGDIALGQEALARVEAFFSAMNEGDVGAMPGILGHDLSEAQRRHYEFHAMFKATGFEWVAGECEVVSIIGTIASVECPMENGNPVFQATGASSVIAPFRLVQDELSERSWVPLGVRFDAPEGPLRAMVDYLKNFHPEDYELCDPANQTAEFTSHGGIARVPECAAVLAPRLADITAWVEAGRPSDWPG